MKDLSGTVALVTGGAVGTELAHAFLAEGASVAMLFRNPLRAGRIGDEFSGSPERFKAIQADLSSYQQSSDAVAKAKNSFGKIDFLLNSLGGWVGGKKLHEHEASELSRMLDMDVIPTFNVMSAVLPGMMERRSGKIINFVSMQVFGTGEGNAVYAASKSAVLALTRAAAAEYRQYGISVFGIAPSIIDTEANRKSMRDADTSKWVTVGEIADAILFLCKAGDPMSGTILKFLAR